MSVSLDRRSFLAAAAALAGVAGVPVRLKALVNSGVPSHLELPENALAAPLYELRIYESAPLLEEILPTAIAQGERTYLIPFADLRERAETWSRINADPRWKPAGSYRFGLYLL